MKRLQKYLDAMQWNEFSAATAIDHEVLIAMQDPGYIFRHEMAVKNYNR